MPALPYLSRLIRFGGPRRQKSEYTELQCEHGSERQQVEGRVGSLLSRISTEVCFRWTSYILTIACALINVWLFFGEASAASTNLADLRNIVTNELPRPNPYIGLEDVLLRQPTSKDPLSLNTWPTFLSPILTTKMNQQYREDPHRHLTSVGTIYPLEMHFWISSKASVQSFAQFRVGDIGMENCSLSILLPRSAVKSARVEIWTISTPRILVEGSLSWRNRPQDETLLDVVQAESGSVAFSRSFICPSRSMQTFRLACAEGLCDIDLWQGKNTGPHGLTLRQLSSI